ncbi:unnamed protein product (macronuclear) [Paramecium tetraurelia]|uniref:non-specific serine/threonine protein kinase n=1 Tax=Paramecium tetraurelia TaxID=5888 RepID=A0C5A6_PARTE|nr:uncharacterized protein GSPATT00006472001 [Paramecium tetraurelia]CAK65973.1 unnamed protein product [Paramecium tetraurelia]|eukprot:XP_001433370.1 hypothetical protein (macronuclear) [Paramecium tetraurelia strain d4-2]
MIEDKSKIQKRVQKYSYFLNDILGEGYSSSVYKGINYITNQVVAIKVINFSTLTTPISQTLLKNEIAILKQLDHENLMKVYEIFETKNNTYIICEYCNDGDLANILEKSNFTQADIMNIFLQIAKGVKALHDQKIIHRDIKPANILRSNGIYKLSDFGFAIVENDFESIIKRFSVGTPVYMAPETVQSNSYSEKSDIWSLGVVLYLMVYKEIPYNLKKDGDLYGKQQQIHTKIMNDKSLTKKIQKVLVGMLELDQQKRMNIDGILSILNEQKKLKCYNSHQNIPFKVLRRASGYDSILHDGSNNDNYGNSQKVLKTQPDELENIDEKTELISFCNHQKQHTFEANNLQQIKLSDEEGQETKFDSSPIITKEKQKKQIRINIPTIQSTYIMKLNSNQNQLPSEHSDTHQHSNPNSTNDTIKNNQFSNCQSQNQINSNSPLLDPKITETLTSRNKGVSPININQSLRNLIVSPLRQRKGPTTTCSLSDFKNIALKANQIQPKRSDFFKQRAKTDLSVNNLSDIDNKKQEKEKEVPVIESLSATIRPTYKFLLFLNSVLKKFDQINTEDKQKCYFLLRKLLAVKACAIKNYCPAQIQLELQRQIDSFEQYFEKVRPVFYNNHDRKFSQYFNNNLEQFTKGFSQQLYNYIQIVNQQLLSKELLIIQEVINENLKQFNDPILFARRWENYQQ